MTAKHINFFTRQYWNNNAGKHWSTYKSSL